MNKISVMLSELSSSAKPVIPKLKYLIIVGIAVLLGVACSSRGSKFSDRFPIMQDGKWGYIDGNGKIAITPQFDGAGLFSEGLAAVSVGKDENKKIGFINPKGEFVINPQFESEFLPSIKPLDPSYYTFSESLAAVQVGKKWGYIDKAGKMVIPPQFDRAKFFIEGLAPVAVGEKWGYVDTNGKYVINPQFGWAGTFVDGVSVVRSAEPNSGAKMLLTKNGTLVSTKGSPHIESNPYVKAEWPAGLEVGQNWGFVDKLGRTVIDPQYEMVYYLPAHFHEGLAAVKSKGKWGYIDTTGKMVIDPQFDSASPFFEGFASVQVGQKYGFIDKTGKFVINPQFDGTYEFVDGLALVWISDSEKNKLSGYIDKTGKYVFGPTTGFW